MADLFRSGGAVMFPIVLVSVVGWWLALSSWGSAREAGDPEKAGGVTLRLRMIAVFVAVLPLLGLLGTVTGMINTFGVIRSEGLGDPRLMAGGIREALVATECGLAAALPLLFFHQALTARIRHAQIEQELKKGQHRDRPR